MKKLVIGAALLIVPSGAWLALFWMALRHGTAKNRKEPK